MENVIPDMPDGPCRAPLCVHFPHCVHTLDAKRECLARARATLSLALLAMPPRLLRRGPFAKRGTSLSRSSGIVGCPTRGAGGPPGTPWRRPAPPLLPTRPGRAARAALLRWRRLLSRVHGDRLAVSCLQSELPLSPRDRQSPYQASLHERAVGAPAAPAARQSHPRERSLGRKQSKGHRSRAPFDLNQHLLPAMSVPQNQVHGLRVPNASCGDEGQRAVRPPSVKSKFLEGLQQIGNSASHCSSDARSLRITDPNPHASVRLHSDSQAALLRQFVLQCSPLKTARSEGNHGQKRAPASPQLQGRAPASTSEPKKSTAGLCLSPAGPADLQGRVFKNPSCRPCHGYNNA